MSSLKILSVEIENFKNLTKMKIDVQGKSLMVVGKNDVGKSTFIQALFAPFLKSYRPLEPVTIDQERGAIEVVIGGELNGEQVEYTVEMYYSPENKKGRLIVTDQDGAKLPSPAAALEAIIGDISFDVDKFLALAKTKSGNQSKEGIKSQIDMLKAFLPMEIQKQLQQCDIDRKEEFDLRSAVNAEVKILEAQNKHEFTDEELEKYANRKDKEEAAVLQKLTDIGKTIEDWSKIDKGVIVTKTEIDRLEQKINYKEHHQHQLDVVQNCIDSLKTPTAQNVATFLAQCNKFKSEAAYELSEIEDAKKLLPDLQKKYKDGQAWLVKNPKKPTTEALLLEQKDIQEFNFFCDEIAKMRENHKVIMDKKADSEKMTKSIKGFVQLKKDIFAKNPLPVKGLTFDEDQVLYKDLPFNEEQHPSSTIIGVGINIAMAMNPNLRVIIIKDGSLLDKNLYNKVLGMIEKKDFQLFIEMVDWDGGELDIKFAESEA